jgi:hypothetical protein
MGHDHPSTKVLSQFYGSFQTPERILFPARYLSEVKRAVQAHNGQLMPVHKTLQVVGLACVPTPIHQHLYPIEAGPFGQTENTIQTIGVKRAC